MSEKKKKKNRKKKEESTFLIDYDLPINSQCRQKFYRKMKDPKFKAVKSTKSVILSNDLKKAKAIHKKASNCGKSNLYRVKKLKMP